MVLLAEVSLQRLPGKPASIGHRRAAALGFA
jgi:hypothetical protein